MSAYQKLIQEVFRDWNNIHRHDTNINMNICPDILMQMIRNNENTEINLWTYWQGSKTHRADIMLVGQDWGNPNSVGCERIIDNIQNGRMYLDGVKPIWATDRNLIFLFSQLTNNGIKLFPDIQHIRYDNLFFTNFCLGYRTKQSTGGMTKDIMMLDSPYFIGLTKTVNPKIILALGADTYDCVVASLDATYSPEKNFWDALNKGTNYHYASINGHPAVVIGLAHCGAFGMNINRKKHAPTNCSDTGKELMARDWRKINRFIQEFHIKPEEKVMQNKNPWPLIRELADLIRNDNTDALEYIDKDYSLEGISGEDSYDFSKAIMDYRAWLAKWEKSHLSEELPFIPEAEMICKKEFQRIKGKNISFFSYASEGAMGTSGEIFFITDQLESRFFNYNHGDISIEDFYRKLPEFRTMNCNDDASDKDITGDWRYYSMGSGNIIFYRTKYKEEFDARCEALQYDHDSICANWKNIAIDILSQS